MSATTSQKMSIKLAASLGMVLMMAFLSACDILATEGARDAIASGRELRQFEDENLRPIEREIEDLWVNEIEPRERELEDLWNEYRNLEQDLLQPLWDQQNDIWAPGGAATLAQTEFDDRRRELDLLQRELELERRDLDDKWQDHWAPVDLDPEYQALEDERFTKQRELDRIYRFGNRPIDEIWDQINDLNAEQSWSNTDAQIEAETINQELTRLYDLQQEAYNQNSDAVTDIYRRAEELQIKLNNLYTFGWDPINEIYAEIESLQGTAGFNAAGVAASDIEARIAEKESLIAYYNEQRDIAVKNLKDSSSGSFDAAGNPIETSASSETTTTAGEKVVELDAKIAALEAERAQLIAEKEADIAHVESKIGDKKDTYNALISDAQAEFQVVSDALLADAAEIQSEIDSLTAADPVANADEIAKLQSDYDAKIAAEQAEEDELAELIAKYESERDSGVAELEASLAEMQALLADGLTDEIDAKIAEKQEDRDFYAAMDPATVIESDDGTTTGDSTTTTDLSAQIAEVEAYWNGLIDQATALILEYKSQLGTTSGTSDVDSRIKNLKLQAEALENALNNDIAALEATINELYRQANSGSTGDSSRIEDIQRHIDSLNDRLTEIWQADSAKNLQNLRLIQELEKQARDMQEELEQTIYRLEEELWELDDKITVYWKVQNDQQQDREAELRREQNLIDDRFDAIQERYWALDEEQNLFYDRINNEQFVQQEKIQAVEQEELGALREQINVLEEELRTFRDQQRELDAQLREAQILVEEKRRELEDKAFDALESAVGTVEEGGDALQSATEEVVPTIDEGDTPTGFNADGTVIQ